MKLVFIEWTDAVGCSAGWRDDTRLNEFNGNCYTCGFILDEDVDFILVAGHVYADLTGSQGAVAIPKKMITKRAALEVP